MKLLSLSDEIILDWETTVSLLYLAMHSSMSSSPKASPERGCLAHETQQAQTQ